MSHNISWINDTAYTVDYSAEAIRDYEYGVAEVLDNYTALFEQEFKVSDGEDIGGLIVYSDSCVYDYENFVGWVK